MTTQETIKEVIDANKNLVRFGDGEIKVLERIDIPYQKAYINIIKDIIKIPIKNLFVRVNHNHCYPNPVGQVIEHKKCHINYVLECRLFIKEFFGDKSC